MNNILVKTTFKDHLILLKPFHKFYTKYWNPKTFLYYIGYTQDDNKTIIKSIEHTLNIEIKLCSTTYNLPNAQNIEIYCNQNIYFVLYKTDKQMDGPTWSNLRNNLYNFTHNFNNFNNYDFYLNTDNDDFFYVKDISNYLKNYNNTEQYDNFHALEYIPNKQFNYRDDFSFISNSYFFRTKGCKNEELTKETSHNWCRKLNLKHKILNEHHTKKNVNCESFDKITDKSLGTMDMICFCFGCLDLNYLLHNKFWIQSSNNTEKYKHTYDTLIETFNKYYTLTPKELKNNDIIEISIFKNIFDDSIII